MTDQHPKRIVVKVGSSSLTDPDGRLDPAKVRSVVSAVVEVRRLGVRCVLVTSGAIAAGLEPLGMARKPKDVPSLQAAASVGQGRLIHEYQKAFARRRIAVGQVLLTQSDILHRESYVHAQHAIDRLLALGVVPVVNENDATGVAEIRFGDNDRLAALVATMMGADLLVILSDIDGIYTDDPSRPSARRLTIVEDPSELDQVKGGRSGSAIGSGGMISKIEAVRTAAAAGIDSVVAAATEPRVVLRVVKGEPVGTRVIGRTHKTHNRKAWIAFARSAQGKITVDPGARTALSDGKKSLLPAGITAIDGVFAVGDVVAICDRDGHIFARGISSYGSDELPALMGRRLPDGAREVVHRDSMVIL
ncbi:MAG: glutamate 5-kinase [Actinomycetota bacterium]